MKHFFPLLRNELRLLVFSPSTYIAAVLFLGFMGFLYLFILQQFALEPRESLPSIDFMRVFWLPVLFMVPLLTMKSFAEEKRVGTLESLMTTPINALELTFAKFFASYVFYMVIWLSCFLLAVAAYITLPSNSVNAKLLDFASWIGGYSFVALSGLLYIAIGILTSSLSKSQLISGMLCFCLLFTLIIGERIIMEIPCGDGIITSTLEKLQAFDQLEDFCHGIVDSRPLVLYATSALFTLGITASIVDSRI